MTPVASVRAEARGHPKLTATHQHGVLVEVITDA
jgi:hypothetical protein